MFALPFYAEILLRLRTSSQSPYEGTTNDLMSMKPGQGGAPFSSSEHPVSERSLTVGSLGVENEGEEGRWRPVGSSAFAAPLSLFRSLSRCYLWRAIAMSGLGGRGDAISFWSGNVSKIAKRAEAYSIHRGEADSARAPLQRTASTDLICPVIAQIRDELFLAGATFSDPLPLFFLASYT